MNSVDAFVMDKVILALPQRVNAANIRDIVKSIGLAKARFVVLDLTETRVVDSTALGAMVRIFREQRERGGAFMLCSVSESVRRILRVTRLDDILPVLADAEAATAAAAAGQPS